MESLQSKRALITGAAKRIGKATTLALAEQGVDVVLHFNTSAREAEAVAEEARSKGVRAWTLSADLARADAAEALIGRAIEQFGPLDILISNAAIFPQNTLTTVTPEDFDVAFRVNALAPFLMARCFASQGRKGAIVNFLDARIVDYDCNNVAYHVSKRTLFALTRMMAIEFAPNVRVNAVAPGLILPPEGKDETYLEQLASTNPLNRYGGVDDVADTVVFLLRSDFVTGQVIFVDGGRHLRGNVYGC